MPSWSNLKLNISTAVSSQDEDMGHFEIPDPMEESTTSLVSSSTSAYSSFPVDVVVYVRVQVCTHSPMSGRKLFFLSLSEPSHVTSSHGWGFQNVWEVHVHLYVCVYFSAEEFHRALGFQSLNLILLGQKWKYVKLKHFFCIYVFFIMALFLPPWSFLSRYKV